MASVRLNPQSQPHIDATLPAAPAVAIKNQDDEQQLVYGEVYAPNAPDSQGDFITAGEIQKMAFEFMRRGLLTNIDAGHSREASGCYVVESFIAREGDQTFIPAG